jgi:Arc/MetJ-type ribon-helix-helix transcriptional regulator
MAKSEFRVQLDKALLADMQRLVDAGEYDNAAAVVEEALRAFLQNFEAVPSKNESLEARAVQGLMAELDSIEREQFEEFVTAYGSVAQHDIRDEEMVKLLEIFSAFGFMRALRAVHEVQDSKVPLSPNYLETMLEKTEPPASERTATTTLRMLDGMHNPLLSHVAKMYEKEIGELTEKIGEQLIVLVSEFSDEAQWNDAFGAAASMNKKNLRYVEGCLRGNGARQAEQKDKGKRGLAKSERVRSERRKQSDDYYRRWEEKRKARQASPDK